jgi:hypothetical protein
MEGMFGPGVNPDGTPRMSAADQYNAHLRERKAGEKQESVATTQKATEDKTAAHNTWVGQRDTGYNNALAGIQQTFRDAGLDPAQYMDTYINPALATAKGSIMDDSPNPASAFTKTLGSDILNSVTTANRTKGETAFNNIFTPDYTNTLLPDTGLDTFVNPILDEQFNPLQQQLKNALGRGTLSQTGYDAALGTLDSKRTGAYGTVRDLGRSILNEDRGYINDIVGGGRTTLAGLKPNQAFDPLTYDTQARSRAAQEQGSFGGELRSKVGGSKFVDLSELLNAGGAAQGALAAPATTPAVPGTVNPLDEEQKKARGLGNTGAF